jgi:hypothetical protein
VPGNADAVGERVERGYVPRPLKPNDLRSRNGQGADDATVILDPEVERLLGVLSASDRFEPLSHNDLRAYPERNLRTMVQDSPAFRFQKRC